MISPPHSPLSTLKVTPNEPENDNPSSPPLSPKRSFSFTDEADDVAASLGYFKRRHLHNEGETARRAPLDPLSASEINNRPRLHSDPTWPQSSFHSLGATPRPRSCDTGHTVPTNGTEDEVICSWPPAAQSDNADSTRGSGRSERLPLVRSGKYSPDARESCRASAAGSALAWPPPSKGRSDLSSPERRTSRRWDVEKVSQSIRSRSSSMPNVRRPPGELWKAESSSDDPARTIYGLVDDRDSILDSSPSPGLAKRRCSESDVAERGSSSLSLAAGSRPLRADESCKAVPPIGAERSRVVSMTPRRSRSLPPAGLSSCEADDRPHPRLRFDSTWRNSNNIHLLEYPVNHDAWENPTSDSPIAEDKFNRLLRQTAHNKFTSKVFSPLGPLRNPLPSFSLTATRTYQRYFPSSTNRLSSRYTKGPERRIRNLCDLYQPLVLDFECTHCQECKRDTIAKRLLATRYRRKRQAAISLLTSPVSLNLMEPLGSPHRGIDEDERNLWEEVAAATSTSIEPFPASPRLQDLHDFRDDDEDDDDDDYPEIPDEDLFSDEEDVVLGRGERLLKFD